MDSVIHMIDQSSINLFTENDATNILVDTLESLYTESKLPLWNGQNMTCESFSMLLESFSFLRKKFPFQQES